MSSLLPPLYNGHASIYLLNGFYEALNAYEDWDLRGQEPQVTIYGKSVRISVVFRRLAQCTDQLPQHVLQALHAAIPHIMQYQPEDFPTTYAQAAGLLRLAMRNHTRYLPAHPVYN
ncbi:hypothetical protein [Pseudochrobactrum sp. HB0163]|uniref:hypothetical protein n=1 Tax=Pseudochrobactrum sp. HB0163 TaxID=3450708 RepID=UPI003F6DAF9D